AIPWAAHWLAGHTNAIDQADSIKKIGWWVTGVIFVIQLIRLIIALMRIRSTLYTITNQRIVIEKGVLSKGVNGSTSARSTTRSSSSRSWRASSASAT
ncbi:MAG TPA: hypothetical protein VF219_05510, partial [Vicinamibacterales bacterium]